MIAAVIAHASDWHGEWRWYEPAIFASPIVVIGVLLWYMGWKERRDARSYEENASPGVREELQA